VFATLTMPMTQPRVVTAVFASGATPVISGKVTRSGSTVGVSGVTITFSNDAGSTRTGADGTYRQAVPYNWSGTATASFTSGGFATPTKTYTRVTLNKTLQNYIWGPDPFIAGRVTKAGISMPGVTITFSNGGGSVVTDASGNYSNTVPYNWTGVATPSTAQGGFNPVSKTYTALKLKSTAQNYTWAPDPFIAGRVTQSGIGMPGVSITFSNGGGTVLTDALGNYSNTVPYNWSGVVTPIPSAGGFNPVSKSYTALKLKSTAQNYAWAPDPMISGKVTKAGSTTPVPGVVLIFSNFVGTVAVSPLCVVTSDLAGAYSQTVPYNWTGRVTATHTNGGFALPVKSYAALKLNSTAQNYSWSPNPVISGKVSRYGTVTGIAGVTLTFSNGGGEATTDALGAYTRTVPYGWTGVVTPTYATPGTFTPATRIYATKVLLNKAAQNFTWRITVIPLQTQPRVTAPTFTIAPVELLHTSGTITWSDENAAMLSVMPEFLVVSLTDGVPEVRLPELAAEGEETIDLEAVAMLSSVVGAADCDLVAVWNVAGEPVIQSLLTGATATGTVMLQDDDGAATLIWDLWLTRP
jgi:hypothetical protein